MKVVVADAIVGRGRSGKVGGRAQKRATIPNNALRSLKKSRSPRNDNLTAAQQQELVLRHRLKARKLGRSILRKWHARLELQEVDSVVDLSLCEAVRRYNPAKGASFMTFMYYHLRGNLIRSVTYAATANSVPTGDDWIGEVSDRTRNISAVEIAEALCSGDRVLPDEVLLKKELIQMSKKACGRLDSLEQEVIRRIYLGGQQLMDIAKELGYSRCHISRVKKKALDSLYGEMKAHLDVDPGFTVKSEAQRPSTPRRPLLRRSARVRAIVAKGRGRTALRVVANG